MKWLDIIRVLVGALLGALGAMSPAGQQVAGDLFGGPAAARELAPRQVAVLFASSSNRPPPTPL